MNETLSHRPILVQLNQDLIKDNKERKQEDQIEQIEDWLDSHISYPVETKVIDGDILAIYVYDSYRAKTIDRLKAIPNKIHNWKVISINNETEF